MFPVIIVRGSRKIAPKHMCFPRPAYVFGPPSKFPREQHYVRSIRGRRGMLSGTVRLTTESVRKSKTQGQPFKNEVTSQLARLQGERTSLR